MTHATSKLFVTVALATAMSAGCLGSGVFGDPNNPNNSDAGVNDDSGRLLPDMAVDIQAEFDSKVKPLLLADCGACHSQISGGVGPGFLSANPDVFTTVISYPGLIGSTPETSRILTKDQHVGNSYHASGAYTPSADLQAHALVISDWIKLYNQIGGFNHATNADLAVKPTIPPFVPTVGTKTIDLGLLDPGLAGTTISFTISMVGTTQIMLSNIKLTATATVGVHIKTPVFATYAAAAPTIALDIDYDYLSADFVAGPGATTTFSPSLTIFSYTAGQMINVSFNVLENSNGAPDMAGGAVTSCKDLTAFNALMPNLTAALPGMNNACSAGNCHGQNGGTGGLNLNGIAASNQAVCNSVLNNVIIATPASSPLYLHPTDASNHAGGKITAGASQTNWLTAVTTFANAQK